jgi:hypothetical protein
MIAVLRQELDSIIRVLYLFHQPKGRRADLIKESVNGTRWRRPNSAAPVTDREMLELSTKLMGYDKYVYEFGCHFIHLSNMHDYNDRDPLYLIPAKERKEIISYIHDYHGGPTGNAVRFVDLVPYLPDVFDKVSGNLDCLLEMLEDGSEDYYTKA